VERGKDTRKVEVQSNDLENIEKEIGGDKTNPGSKTLL